MQPLSEPHPPSVHVISTTPHQKVKLLKQIKQVTYLYCNTRLISTTVPLLLLLNQREAATPHADAAQLPTLPRTETKPGEGGGGGVLSPGS
jgi:hypothetical protein